MKNFFRGGIAFAILSMLFGQTVAAKTESVNAADSLTGAQEQVLTKIFADVRSMYKYLSENQEDTLCEVVSQIVVSEDMAVWVKGEAEPLFAGDTLTTILRTYYGGPRTLSRDTVWVIDRTTVELVPVMSVEEAIIDSLAQLTGVVDHVNSGRVRDRNGYRIRFDNGNEYTLTSKAMNKYGWVVGGYGGIQTGNHVVGIIGGGQIGYTGWWGEGSVSAGAARNRYTANAEPEFAGKSHWALDLRAMGWLKPIKLDKYDVNRVLIGGGYGLMFFDTKSVGNIFGLEQSGGMAGYFAGGLKYERRCFNKGLDFFAEGYVLARPNVIQNGGQVNNLGAEVRLGMNFDLQRLLINHK